MPRAPPAQLDPVAIGQRLDFVDNRIDDPPHVAVGEVRMSPGEVGLTTFVRRLFSAASKRLTT
jgi:hypothetical protein